MIGGQRLVIGALGFVGASKRFERPAPVVGDNGIAGFQRAARSRAARAASCSPQDCETACKIDLGGGVLREKLGGTFQRSRAPAKRPSSAVPGRAGEAPVRNWATRRPPARTSLRRRQNRRRPRAAGRRGQASGAGGRKGHARPLAEGGARAKKKPAVDREAEDRPPARSRADLAHQGKNAHAPEWEENVKGQAFQKGLLISNSACPALRPRSRRSRSVSLARSRRSRFAAAPFGGDSG